MAMGPEEAVPKEKPIMMIVTLVARIDLGILSMLSAQAGPSKPPIARPLMKRKTISCSGVAAKPTAKVKIALAIVLTPSPNVADVGAEQ